VVIILEIFLLRKTERKSMKKQSLPVILTAILFFALACSTPEANKSTTNEENNDPDTIPIPVVAPDTPAIVPIQRPADGFPAWHEQKAGNLLVYNQKIIFIGDSITQQWVNNGIICWNEMMNKYENKLTNLGYGGDLTQHVIWRLENGEFPAGINPEYVVLKIGTNNSNAGGRNTPEAIAAGIGKICELINRNSPKTKVLLFSILPRGVGMNEQKTQTNFLTNDILKTYDGYLNIQYVDISGSYLNEDGSLKTALFTDNLHLTTAGYKIWKDKIVEIIGDHAPGSNNPKPITGEFEPPLIYKVNPAGAFTGTSANNKTVTAALGGGASTGSAKTPASAAVSDVQVLHTNAAGYAALGESVGAVLKTLDAWTVEIYAFLDGGLPNGSDVSPQLFGIGVCETGMAVGPAIWACARGPRFQIRPDSWGAGSDGALTGSSHNMYTAGQNWPETKGQWRHFVFTVDDGSIPEKRKMDVYMDGNFVMGFVTVAGSAGKPWRKTTELALMRHAYLGKPFNWGLTENAANTHPVSNSQYYSFSVYSGYKTLADVEQMIDRDLLNKLNGN
jgi:lysophospholipase L1-like esterase